MPRGGLAPAEIYWRGKRIDVPPEMAHAISLRAAEIARRTAPRGPHNSRSLIRATWQVGQIGVHIPPQAIHLLYLDRGIRPFIPWRLEGKVVPIRDPDGTIHFRTAKNVGRPRILSRDERGRIVHSKIRWRFPGLEPMNFIQRALEQAIREFFQSITEEEMLNMLRQVPGAIGQFFSRINRGGAH